MKHLKKIIIGCVIAVVIIAIGTVGFMYNSISRKPFKGDKEVTITIKAGEGVYSILDELSNKDFVRNEMFIKLYIKLHGDMPKITPGEYTIKSDISLSEFFSTLNSQDTIKVVIPEGYTVDQIADTLANAGLFTKEEFLNAVQKYPLPNYIKKVPGRRYQLEGFLFPDTYEFARGETPDNVIKTMLNTFNLVLSQEEEKTGVKLEESQIDTIVNKASIIEREANTYNDMEKVSSVIDNRLAINMKLQIDATVIYALGKHVDKVYYKDLTVNSPYNTYLHKGLPIGPICNPGRKAIEAALKPAKTDYIYYILNGKEHYFTKSYADFEKKKAEVNS